MVQVFESQVVNLINPLLLFFHCLPEPTSFLLQDLLSCNPGTL